MKAKKKNRKKMVHEVKKKVAEVVESVKADPFGVGAAARGVADCAHNIGVMGLGGGGGGGGGGAQGGAWHPGADDTRCTLETHKLLDRLGAKEFPRHQLPERLKHFMQSILASVPSDFREGPNDSHKTVDRLIFALVNALDAPADHKKCAEIRDALEGEVERHKAMAIGSEKAHTEVEEELAELKKEYREFVLAALSGLGMQASGDEGIRDTCARILGMLGGIAATKDELISLTDAEGAEKRETWGWIVRRIRERLEVERQMLDVTAHARYGVICAIGNLEEEMLVEIAREVSRARAKHPWNGNRWHSLGALTEETGEVARAMNDKEGDDRVMKEAVQVAATAIRLAVQK